MFLLNNDSNSDVDHRVTVTAQIMVGGNDSRRPLPQSQGFLVVPSHHIHLRFIAALGSQLLRLCMGATTRVLIRIYIIGIFDPP